MVDVRQTSQRSTFLSQQGLNPIETTHDHSVTVSVIVCPFLPAMQSQRCCECGHSYPQCGRHSVFLASTQAQQKHVLSASAHHTMRYRETGFRRSLADVSLVVELLSDPLCEDTCVKASINQHPPTSPPPFPHLSGTVRLYLHLPGMSTPRRCS